MRALRARVRLSVMAKAVPSPVLPALHAVASLAATVDDPAIALREILAQIRGAIPCDSGCILLLNPDSGRLEIEADFGLPSEGDRSFIPGQGIPGWVAFHAKPLLVPDIAHEPRYRSLRRGVRAQLAAPLLSEDGLVLGVAMLDRDLAGTFTDAERDSLAALCHEASGVLRRLWQVRHLQGKARQFETLIQIGHSLVSKLDQQELFDAFTRDARGMMQARACCLYLYDSATETVRVGSYISDAVPDIPTGDLPLDSCLIAAAIHARRPVAYPNIRSPGFIDVSDLPREEGLLSLLATPVLYEGEVLGVLAIFTGTVHRFDNDEKRLCSALAGLGAVALQNVRLYARVFKSEESLRKNERLTTLGLLAAEIAHEIRNPLTVLKLLHGGLGFDIADNDPRKTDMRVIGEKLDQLEGIVTRVLNFAKAPTSLHARCSLAEIVDDTLLLVRLKMAQNKIHLAFEPPANPIVVEGHKGQIQQVLLNLLINAMQAMPEGGVVTISLGVGGPSNHEAILDITDSGTGIPEAIKDRIFDSFLSGRPDGTGLGLAIAKRVLKSHYGDIALVATSTEGTTLRVTLPLARG